MSINEIESNNSRTSANTIALLDPVVGALSSWTDLDYYSVPVTSIGTLSVVFDVPSSSTSTDYFKLGLFDSAGTLLSLFSTGSDKTYTVGAPAIGTYYIGVAGNDYLNGYYYNSGQYSLTASNAAGSSNGYESESNDTLATADAATLGTAITGQLSTYADWDCYSVTATSVGTLSVVFDVPSSSTTTNYFKLGLFDSTGTLLSLFSTGSDKTYTVGAPATGTYYIGVTGNDYLDGYYYNSGQYSLTASNTAGSSNGYESESNDTLATADAATLGTAITGQLSTYTDWDCYSVTATSVGTLSVVFDVPSNSTSTGYFKLGLFDSAGTLLSLFSTGSDKTYTVGAPATGTYYIGVTGNDYLDGYYYNSGQYRLTASNTAGSSNGYESESNDTLATADAATLGAAITGQVSTYADLDFYSLAIASAGTLSVTFDVPTSNTYSDYFELGLFDNAGTLLSLFSTGSDKTYTVGAPAVGNYYIGVTGNDYLDGYYYDSGQYSLTASNAAGSSNGYESESNGTLATADTATLGTAITGQLSTSTDLDFYSVAVTSAGTLSVTFDVPTNSTYSDYFELGLYDSTGTLLSLFATGTDKIYSVGASAAGTYYLGVGATAYYHNSGQYNLTAAHTAGSTSGYESEANDTLETADAATLGTAITGQLSTSTDLDFYSVAVASAGTLSLTFDVPTNSTYSDYFELGLFDSTGNLLSLFSTGTDKTYSVGAPAAGTYYLGVGAPAYYYNSGQYSLTASHTAGSASGYESEANDTLATADAATLGTAITGQLSTSTDLDFYSVAVASAGTLSVTFDVPTNSTYSDYFELGLFDSTGNLLSLFSTGTDKTYSVGAPAAGTYYLGVGAPAYYYNSGQYSLTASHTAGSVSGYESEANDTRATADDLISATPIGGQLASNADTDYFTLQVAQAGVVSVTFDAPTDSTYTDYFRVSVVDGSGNVIASHETGQDIAFQAAVSVAGSYYLNVDSTDYYYNSDQYTLTATTSDGTSGFELEPNDDFANAINSGAVIRGQVATSTDVDWFALNVTETGALSVSFDAPTSSSYTDYFHVWLFDESGNLLASQATGQDITFNASAPVAGNYFVAVTAGDYFHDTGQYALAVTSSASAVAYESETNDTDALADTLTLGVPIRGQLSSASDDDRFVVTLNSGGTITATFDAPTNSTWSDYFQIAIYDQGGTLLGYRSSGSDVAFDTDVSVSGTYYVTVSADDWYYNGGEYRLTVNALLDDPIPAGAIVGTPVGDQLTGTTGDDLIYGLGGNDQIDGGTGVDTVVFRSATANLSINTIEGMTSVRGDYAAGEHAYSTSRLWNIEKLQTYDDTQALAATAISPILGTLQNDVLYGTTADDILDGLGGSDYIDGGAGTDTLVLFGVEDKFSTLTVGGITRIKGATDAYEYAGQTIKTTNVEELAFSQDQTKALVTTDDTVVYGTSGANKLVGSSGNEVFDGQGGKDTIDGGAGTDTVVFFDRADNFTVTFPSGATPTVTIVGKTGSEYAGQAVVASNIESLAFTDRTVSIANLPSLVLTPATTILAEGGSGATLEVALSVAPTDAVSLNIAGGSQLSSSASSLTFDATNWATPQSVTITAVDDTVYESTHSGSLTVSVQTTDILYDNLGSSTLSYTISDNDNPTPTTGQVSGKLWNDFDKDRVCDPGEARLSGWTVFDDANNNGTLDSGEEQTTSDATGNYLLGNLTPGSHTIVAVTPSGWLPTYPGLGNATATVIANTAASGEVTVETLIETVVSSAVAQATYDNLGTATNIAAFHADPRFAHVNGQGYAVVVIDTGIDLNHPYFGPDNNNDGVADRIVYQADFYGKGDSNASDGHGHGTHVAGIIGSSSPDYPGIAPEVSLIVLKVFSDSGDGDDGAALKKAADWIVDNVDKYDIVAVNLSLGFGQFHTSPVAGFLNSEFQTLANSGVVVVSASGNSYDDQYDDNASTTGKAVQGVSYPSSDPYSLSVGAVWAGPGSYFAQTGTTDAIAAFSQRDDGVSDIFAPGIFIDSAANGATHRVDGGTSMASPEIAGMVALAQQLAEQELGRRLSFDEIRSLLKGTGDAIVDGDDENDVVPNTGLTFYRVDMLALAEAILEMKPPASHTVSITAGTTTTGKDFGFGATTSVQALSGDDMVFGTVYGETLRGGAGNDQIQGGPGDDELHGEGGNDTLDGSEGTDQAVYAGNRSNYTVVPTLKGYAVTDNIGTDGSDTLANIETLIFADTTATRPTGTVSVSGTAAQGQTLTAANTLADVDGLGTISYQWQADGATISGATSTTLALTEAQVGKAITVTASYTDGQGTAEAVTSASTVTVANVNDSPTGNVTIKGTAAQGYTLTAANTLADADGLGTIGYQWQVDGTSISGATSNTFALTEAEVGKDVAVTASYTDGHSTAESVASTGILVTALPIGKTIDFLAYSWKVHTLLDSVSIAADLTPAPQTTDSSGGASFTGITDTILPLTVARTIPSTEVTLTDQAVNLQDAIAILKLIVGLEVNGAGKPLSPYQALAADFDANGQVQLTDAIGVLKHVVGLSAPNPAWHFVSETDSAIPQVAALSPGAAPAITLDLSGAASTVQVGLVAYLSGDVDGSYVGPIDAVDLDDVQPDYFVALTQTHGLDPAQFGVY